MLQHATCCNSTAIATQAILNVLIPTGWEACGYKYLAYAMVCWDAQGTTSPANLPEQSLESALATLNHCCQERSGTCMYVCICLYICTLYIYIYTIVICMYIYIFIYCFFIVTHDKVKLRSRLLPNFDIKQPKPGAATVEVLKNLQILSWLAVDGLRGHLGQLPKDPWASLPPFPPFNALLRRTVTALSQQS